MPPERRQIHSTGQAAISDFLGRPRLRTPTVNTASLNAEQKAVYDRVMGGAGTFITGDAGTGKTYLMQYIIDGLCIKFSSADAVGITSSTGVSALNIGGQTLHSWAGVSGQERSVKDMIKKIERRDVVKGRWISTKALVIDELPMIAAEYMDMLDGVARHIRGNQLPFGGIQVIGVGDFLQLPPVSYPTLKLTFQARCWSSVFPAVVRLVVVQRQVDRDFVIALNKCRIGQLDSAAVDFFKSLQRPIDATFLPHIDPIYLFPTRKEVHQLNFHRLNELEDVLWTFTAIDDYPGGTNKKLFNDFPVEGKIHLKTGAQVMLLQNVGDGLANGSTGRVVGFFKPGQADRHNAGRKVGLLRNIRVNARDYPDDCNITSRAELADLRDLYPLVKFTTKDGPEWVLVLPSEFTLKIKDTTVARRFQLPLCLAWALTVHKSQSQSLDKVVVDLDKAFADGQAYVALSRARSPKGLEIRHFKQAKVKTNKEASEWYLTTFPSV